MCLMYTYENKCRKGGTYAKGLSSSETCQSSQPLGWMPGTKKSEMEKAGTEGAEAMSGVAKEPSKLGFVALLVMLHPRKAKLPWGSDGLSTSVILQHGGTNNNKQAC